MRKLSTVFTTSGAFLLGSTILCSSGTALAQQANTNDDRDIVVTASKREQNLQDVPLAITAIGAVTGMGAALVLTRWLSTFLYGIETRDAFTFVAVPLVLVLVSAAACFVPARRASRIDPLRVMKAS